MTKNLITITGIAILLMMAGGMLLFVSCQNSDTPNDDFDCCGMLYDIVEYEMPELNDENCALSVGYFGRWTVELRLKSRTGICPTENIRIRCLILRHDVELYQSMPGAITSELLLLYILRGRDCGTRREVIRDFLATGLFEFHREFAPISIYD